MQRDALASLAAWVAAPDRKPLVLRGARQTGKTWLVKRFAEQRGSLAYLNFERDPELAGCFTSNDPAATLTVLEARLRQRIEPRNCLLFLDEIQAAPAVLAKLRWFAEELPDLAVVAAGSLLDFALTDPGFAMPVGRVTFGHLEPMTFAEFLVACGDERLLAAARSATPEAPVPEPLHEQLLARCRTWSLVGGMPAAVAAWISTGSFVRTSELHRDLLQAFRDDFAKYGKRVDTRRIQKVFAALPALVGRKFQPSAVDREDRSTSLRDAFAMLVMARIATPIQRTAANAFPLGAEVDERYQKVCMLDIGLWSTLAGVDAAAIASGGSPNAAFAGQLAEQFVGQELRACRPFNELPSLFTWVRQARASNAEVDYVLQVGDSMVPIEVKAGAPGALRSLHMMVQEKGLELGVRVSTEPLQLRPVTTALPIGKPRRFQLLSVPFYMVAEIPRLVRAVAGAGG